MLSYEFKPEVINSIIPAPRYPTNALAPNATEQRNNKYNTERRRTSVLTKRQNEYRFTQGRMYTHIKLN